MVVLTIVRAGQSADLDRLTAIWFERWCDAHLAIVPAALTRVRTLGSFRDRLTAGLDQVRVAERDGVVVGFVMFKHDEIYQCYVAPEARGSDVAGALMDDAEATLSERGVKTAWLACAIGNDRAARFYETRGWRRAATVTYEADTSEGPFPLDNWRYEKALG